MRGWGDLAARAAGLGTRLVGGERLRALARDGDLDAIAEAIAGRADDRGPAERAATDLEDAIRDRAAAPLHRLLRRAGARADLLQVLLERDDRHAVRALLRGAVAGTPAEARVAGLVPTPALPAPALRLLASQPNAAGVVDALESMGSPYAEGLRLETRRERPDLYRIERQLDSVFAARLRRRARRGDRALRAVVEAEIDAANCWSAIAAAGAGDGEVADGVPSFLEGGSALGRARFEEAARARDRAGAMRLLAPAFPRTPLGDALGRGVPAAELDDAALATVLQLLRRESRREPLGTARVLWYLARLRAEVRDLDRLVYGVTLHAPRPRLERAILSP